MYLLAKSEAHFNIFALGVGKTRQSVSGYPNARPVVGGHCFLRKELGLRSLALCGTG